MVFADKPVLPPSCLRQLFVKRLDSIQMDSDGFFPKIYGFCWSLLEGQYIFGKNPSESNFLKLENPISLENPMGSFPERLPRILKNLASTSRVKNVESQYVEPKRPIGNWLVVWNHGIFMTFHWEFHHTRGVETTHQQPGKMKQLENGDVRQ